MTDGSLRNKLRQLVKTHGLANVLFSLTEAVIDQREVHLYRGDKLAGAQSEREVVILKVARDAVINLRRPSNAEAQEPRQ